MTDRASRVSKGGTWRVLLGLVAAAGALLVVGRLLRRGDGDPVPGLSAAASPVRAPASVPLADPDPGAGARPRDEVPEAVDAAVAEAAPPPEPERPVDPLAPDYGPFVEKYGDFDLDMLRAACSRVAGEAGAIASPITHRKLATGDYEELGPFSPENRFHLRFDEYGANSTIDPIVSTATVPIDGTDQYMVRLILVVPEEYPELLPLCQEKQWLKNRITERVARKAR